MQLSLPVIIQIEAWMWKCREIRKISRMSGLAEVAMLTLLILVHLLMEILLTRVRMWAMSSVRGQNRSTWVR